MKRSAPFLLGLVPLLASALAGAKGPPNHDASYGSKAAVAAPRSAASAAPAAFVASRDERRGSPSFLWAARGAGLGLRRIPGMTPEGAAWLHLDRHAGYYGLSPEAMATTVVRQVHDTGRGGIIVVLRQAPGGVELFHHDVKVLLDRDLDLVAIGGSLHPAAVAKPKAPRFVLHEPEAVAAALGDLHGIQISGGDIADTKATKAGYHYYDLAPSSAMAQKGLGLTRRARVKRVYFPIGSRLAPGYFVEVESGEVTATTSLAYAYVIAGDDGRLLYREDLTHTDTFNYRVFAEPTGDLRPKDGPIADFTPHPTGTPDGSYPAFAAPDLVTIDGFNKFKDPWLAPNATETKGNNVDAYTDDGAPDGFSAQDTRATTTSPGTFDHVYDTSLGPQVSASQKMAAVTSIFYTTNWLHDYWYDSGFDEAGGNAQSNNYGRGGVGGDPLLAEGQDRAPNQRNNANMSAFADGESPRMQMFVWDGKSSTVLGVQPLNQNLPNGVADFGPQSFDVTGTVALVDDGNGTTTDACEAIVNDVSGKIALIDRGTCTFKQKTIAAQSAGAIGVILANNNPNEPPPGMSGNPGGTPITIPILSVTLSDGDAIKAALANGPVTAELQRTVEADRDGTIDNTVVAHEWGHYLHLRNVDCGSSQCAAQSEGWGDFVSLHMVLRQGDDLSAVYPSAVYATASFPDDPGYFGIRRYPYSTDQTKNPLTFKHIADAENLPNGVPIAVSTAFVNNAEAHAAGEVWASMLFEAYTALVAQSEGPSPKYSFDEARRRMSDYVVAGLKLAPTDPTFTEQRDAILAAAAAADPGDLDVMAQAFARRGAGTCAVSPPRDSYDFAGVKESFTVQPNVALVSMKLDDSVKTCDGDGHLDAEETGKLTVTVMNGGTTELASTSAKVTSTTNGVSFPGGANLTFGPIPPLGTATATVDVALDIKLLTMTNADITVTLVGAASCDPNESLSIQPLVNFDQIAAASNVDTVEADTTTWSPAGIGASAVWSIRDATGGNRVWSGIDYPSPSDTSLGSPTVVVSDTASFVLTFDHRHSFEQSDGVNWDGSVIEISVDGGMWEDISMYADPGYGGTIGDPDPQGAQNTLRDRQGFIGANATWPAMETVKVDLGTALAGKSVRVRFRIGTDDAVGGTGWEIDNIQLDGITSTPFASIIDDKGSCGTPPIANAGPDQKATSSTVVTLDGSLSADPDGLPLTFVWKQTVGTPVGLAGATNAQLVFVAPKVTTPETLTFELTVSDGAGTGSDTADVVVSPGSGPQGEPDAGADAGVDAGDISATPPLAASGGCGCDVAPANGSRGVAASVLALIALAARRRRRS